MIGLGRQRPRVDGFTLLEVAVALAVLAIGLVAVIDINSGAARLHEQSQHLTLGTLLAKGKMIDLEAKLNEDGFSDFDQQIDGTFEAQGHPEIRWHAEILRPDVSKANDQITQLIAGTMGGGATGGAGGAGGLSGLLGQSSLVPSGSALPPSLSALTPPSSGPDDPNSPTATGMGGAMGGLMTTMIQSQVGQLITLIQSGVRECRLTVTWPDGAREDNLSIATHFVILQATGSGVSSATPAGQGSPQSGAATPGSPAIGGANPLPGGVPGGGPGSFMGVPLTGVGGGAVRGGP